MTPLATMTRGAENAPADGKPHDAGILNRPAALKRMGGNQELMEEYLQLAMKDLDARTPMLAAALAANDAAEVRSVAHAMKSIGLTMEAGQVADLGLRIQSAGEQGDVALARRLFERMETALERLRSLI